MSDAHDAYLPAPGETVTVTIADHDRPPSRGVKEVVAEVVTCPGHSAQEVLDFARCAANFGGKPVEDVGEVNGYIGSYSIPTYPKAHEALTAILGTPDAVKRLVYAIATWRQASVDQMGDVEVLRALIMTKAGLDRDDHLLFSMRGLDCATVAGWVGGWEVDSLRECVNAGMSADEIAGWFASGCRPDESAVRTLAALHSDS